MRMIREVLRLHHSCGLSNKKISKALNCSRGAVAEYIHRAEAAGFSWPLPEGLSDVEIENRLFPPLPKTKARPQPDCTYIHAELKKKGVTLIQLWSEYREDHPDGYGLTQFCEIYGRFADKLNISMRQEHKAGDKAFSDFAGKTLAITDPHTGEVKPAYVFVCTLGASNFTFADVFWDMTVESWCNGHARAFSYFDGCPRIVVPDNPKPVISKSCPYEPDVNPGFAQMAAHYDVAVMPARVRKPKDKAKVEAAVLLVTRWILAVLRNRTFFSLEEARRAVRELVERLNDRPFKKIPGTRRSLYEVVDKPHLKPLPIVPYEYCSFKSGTVNIDYHVEYEKHYYSVPYQYRHEAVEIVATATTIEILHKGIRIASHARSVIPHKASTAREHRPKNHQEWGDWPPERIVDWANKIGPATCALVQTIMERQKYPEQGFRSCLGILRLTKHVDNDRLEAACARALAIRGFSYKSVKSILDSNLDRRPLPEKPNQLAIVHTNIRGPLAFAAADAKENHNANATNDRQDESPEAGRNGESSRNTDGAEGSQRAVL